MAGAKSWTRSGSKKPRHGNRAAPSLPNNVHLSRSHRKEGRCAPRGGRGENRNAEDAEDAARHAETAEGGTTHPFLRPSDPGRGPRAALNAGRGPRPGSRATPWPLALRARRPLDGSLLFSASSALFRVFCVLLFFASSAPLRELRVPLFSVSSVSLLFLDRACRTSIDRSERQRVGAGRKDGTEDPAPLHEGPVPFQHLGLVEGVEAQQAEGDLRLVEVGRGPDG